MYAIHYRIKKIRHYKAAEKRKTADDQTFHNPVYDVYEAGKQDPAYSHENPAYQMEDPSECDTSM